MACRYNHDIKFITASWKNSKVIVYHITNYITKSSIYKSHMYFLLQTVMKKIETTFNITVSKATIFQSHHLLIKCLNTIGSQQEISATRALNFLLKYPNHITNYKFTYIQRYNLSFWIQEQEQSIYKTTETCKDRGIHKTFKLQKQTTNKEFILHNFYIDYRFGPLVMDDISPYKFINRTSKSKNIHGNRYLEEHPQYYSHSVQKLDIETILILQSYKILANKSNPENYSRVVCILFTHWRTIEDLKASSSTSWEDALHANKPILSP